MLCYTLFVLKNIILILETRQSIMRTLKLLLALFIVCLAPVALAQADCPAIISSALAAVDSACADTARNQLCYGNITLSATPRESVADFHFEQSGDLVNVADVQTLQLSSFSLTDEQWGVALMKVQANLPDTLPGQNVTFLLFGDVSMSDAGDQNVELPVTATGGVNVRQLPSTSAVVIESLEGGQEVTGIGRLPDSSWIRIRLDESGVGWVSADFLDGDLNRLLPIEPGAPAFGPMQAFYFTTGQGDAPCDEAPNSGILIQTPEGAGTIQLRANNVDIQLGSTVYLQAIPGDAMYISVVEGHATLTADGQSQVVPAGTVAAVPLDANGAASGAPEFPVAYDPTVLAVLPLDILPDEATLAPVVAEDDIPAAIDIAIGQPPNGGRWLHTETITNRGCPPPEATFEVGDVFTMTPIITFNEDRSTVMIPLPETVTYYRTGEATYVGYFNGATWTLTFTSPTTYVGSLTSLPDNPACSFDTTYTGVYLS
jgi:hypothetical protein